MPFQALLKELGRRIRLQREARGLSVAELARRAELSRRHLTEAEAGRANLSLVTLAQLARALGVPLATLCDLPLESRAPERVALVGLRGAGKSSVGRALALRLEAPLVELDRRVEELAGLSLGELFALHGEEHFHRLEAEALEAVLCEGTRCVIATGGSIVAASSTFARLKETCRTVWLKATPEEHYTRVMAQGDRRPMASRPRAMEELRAMLSAREPLYASCEITISTSGRTVEEVAAAIAAEFALVEKLPRR
jgi:XRE family aerobic/anaerobic benzoate catabolism transcriptional regulator